MDAQTRLVSRAEKGLSRWKRSFGRKALGVVRRGKAVLRP